MDYMNYLQAVISMSEAMLEHAENDEWEALAEIETKRHQLLLQEVTLPDDEKVANQATESLQHLIHLNDKIAMLGQQCLTKYSKELRNISTGRRAVNAYSR